MPELTPTQQAIVDLVEREGPMTIQAFKAAAWKLMDPPELYDALVPVLSRGLLLEREGTVECERCGGSGQEPQTMPRPRGDHPCQKCKATGSVKERVIGVACTYGCEDGWIDLDRNWRGPPGVVREHWIPCVCIDTPGLDPGSESEAR